MSSEDNKSIADSSDKAANARPQDEKIPYEAPSVESIGLSDDAADSLT